MVVVGRGGGGGGGGSSLVELESRRRRDESDAGAGAGAGASGVVAAKAACLYTTPSSSRKYAGPIFLFSALHCARTRSRRRFAALEFGFLLGGSGAEVVASRGSERERKKTESGFFFFVQRV